MSKTDLKPTKEQLQKQLNAIAWQEKKDLIKIHYPEFKKFEGRYFKVKNSYGGAEKRSDWWWLYIKVTQVNPDDVYDTGGNGVNCRCKGYSFQTCKYGNVEIDKNKRTYISSLVQEITEKEFNEAWNKLMSTLEKLG